MGPSVSPAAPSCGVSETERGRPLWMNRLLSRLAAAVLAILLLSPATVGAVGEFRCGLLALGSLTSQGLLSSDLVDHAVCLDQVKLVTDHFGSKASFMCGAQSAGTGFYLVSESFDTCYKAARALTQRVKHGAKFSCHGSKPIFLEDCPKKIVHLNNFLQKLNDTANGKPAIAGSKKRGKIVTLDNSMETPTPTKADSVTEPPTVAAPTLPIHLDPCRRLRCSMDCVRRLEKDDGTLVSCGWDRADNLCKTGQKTTTSEKNALLESSAGDCSHHTDLHYSPSEDGGDYGGNPDLGDVGWEDPFGNLLDLDPATVTTVMIALIFGLFLDFLNIWRQGAVQV